MPLTRIVSAERDGYVANTTATDVGPACRAGLSPQGEPSVQSDSQSRSNADVDATAPVAAMPQSPARQAGPTEIVLAPKEREIHEKGLVSVLKQIHDELDAAVFDAYGWPHDLSDEESLECLVALNHERAEKKTRSHPLAASRVPKPRRWQTIRTERTGFGRPFRRRRVRRVWLGRRPA